MTNKVYLDIVLNIGKASLTDVYVLGLFPNNFWIFSWQRTSACNFSSHPNVSKNPIFVSIVKETIAWNVTKNLLLVLLVP